LEEQEPQLDLFGFTYQASSEEVRKLRKRELRNLLTSYADEADVFAEIVQNAVDAITTARSDGLYSDEKRPELTIGFGRRASDRHYFFVSENGVGMSAEVAGKFTVPGFSLRKRLGTTVGYKGVGASFFFAASNRISFRTVTSEGALFSSSVVGAWDWIMGETEPEPRVESEPQIPDRMKPFLSESHGTAVCYYFHEGLKPKDLSALVRRADTPDEELIHWAHFLAAKTALGRVAPPYEDITVRLVLDDGVETAAQIWTLGDFGRDDKTIGYPYPHRVFKVGKDVEDILKTPEGQRVIAHKGRHQALHRRWSKEDILGLTPEISFSDDERVLVEAHLDFFDLLFAYSTDILDEVHDRTGCRARQLRYGIRISCDGVPQGRMTEFDLTSNQGLGRQAHGVIAFTGLELDTGRKIPANEAISEVVRKIGVRTMGLLANFRWALKARERPDPSYDLDKWRNATTERSSSSLVRPFFELLNKQPPLHVDPDSENDVIALFGGLLAIGELKGYRMVALSGFNQYDGLINISTDQDLRDPNDPFSIRNDSNLRGGEGKVLEFKLQFEDVIEDFESKKKSPSDVDLLVCWTLPSMNLRRGRIETAYGDRNDYREIYGMTHLWTDENGTSDVPILSLKHFVAERLKYLEVGHPGIGTARFNDIATEERNESI
jgi:hypothetical protein